MIISLVVLVCHVMAGISDPVCHEEMVINQSTDLSWMMCQQASQSIVAEWKTNSTRFKSDEWQIQAIRCVAGNYVARDAI